MSAPVTERRRAPKTSSTGANGRTGTGTVARRRGGAATSSGRGAAPPIPAHPGIPPIPAQRVAPGIPPERGPGPISLSRDAPRVGAARRAYAKRDDRARRLAAGGLMTTLGSAGRAQFVPLVLVLLGAGLVATLWLSTAAAADSYRLQDARTQARTLTEQSERLHREVASMEAAPVLAQRATELGLVPVQDPARLVVGRDGRIQVVGDPTVATAPAPPAPPAPVPPSADPVGGPTVDPAGGPVVDPTGGPPVDPAAGPAVDPAAGPAAGPAGGTSAVAGRRPVVPAAVPAAGHPAAPTDGAG